MKVSLKKRQFFTFLGLVSAFLIFLFILTNLYLSLYECEENLQKAKKRLDSLYSYFNKFANISFPIAYSLSFYENYFDLATIYVITPSNNRRVTQLADLTRLRNTLWLIPKIVWILIEDSSVKSAKISTFLKNSNISYVHLNQQTPDELIIKSSEKVWTKPRGVLQRNKGLEWLRDNIESINRNGVVYFADDDNTYDIKLFEEIRNTKKVSVWPVAFVGEIKYERPVCKDGKVVDWFCMWGEKRPFPVDMAGFAVNLNLILAHPSARFSQHVPRGMQESHFLSHLISVKDLECKAENATKIYVWHTQTQNVLLVGERSMDKKSLVYDKNILNQI